MARGGSRDAGPIFTKRSSSTATFQEAEPGDAPSSWTRSGWDSIEAEMLVTTGGNSARIRSEAAFAKMCGACPIPAGFGKTNGRHRLNCGGNRQASASLYRTAILRMRLHKPTMA
jgi:hypothetical protein